MIHLSQPIDHTLSQPTTQVFYVGALGDDSKVRVTALLSQVGDTLLYVKDLGDFIAHRITVTDVRLSTDQIPEEMGGSAHLVDGANAGIPEVTLGGGREGGGRREGGEGGGEEGERGGRGGGGELGWRCPPLLSTYLTPTTPTPSPSPPSLPPSGRGLGTRVRA